MENAADEPWNEGGAGRFESGADATSRDLRKRASFSTKPGFPNARRLVSRRCFAVMLSEVMFPPNDPQPSVSDGSSQVDSPIAPWLAGVLTRMRCVGFSSANSQTISSLREWIVRVWSRSLKSRILMQRLYFFF